MTSADPRLVGVDGCRGGWIAVSLLAGRGVPSASLHETMDDLVDAHPGAAVIAIDVPIGLPERGPRACDLEARRALGPRRGTSVFSAPIRPILAARSHAEACAIGRARDGRGLSLQAWNILPKIAEVDDLLARRPELVGRLREVHPELSFANWAGAPIEAPKRSAAGRARRRALVDAWVGPDLVDRALGLGPRSRLAEDDVLDAVAALRAAERIARGAALRLPETPPRDSRGLEMEILA